MGFYSDLMTVNGDFDINHRDLSWDLNQVL